MEMLVCKKSGQRSEDIVSNLLQIRRSECSSAYFCYVGISYILQLLSEEKFAGTSDRKSFSQTLDFTARHFTSPLKRSNLMVCGIACCCWNLRRHRKCRERNEYLTCSIIPAIPILPHSIADRSRKPHSTAEYGV